METSGISDKKYNGLWLSAAIFTAISLLLHLVCLIAYSYFSTFDPGDQWFNGYKITGITRLLTSPLFPFLALVFYIISRKKEKENNALLIGILSYPVIISGYIARELSVPRYENGISCFKIDQIPPFTVNEFLQFPIEMQAFLIITTLFFFINIFLLLSISPYKIGLFRTMDFKPGKTAGEYIQRLGSFFTNSFPYLYIISFISLLYIILDYQINEKFNMEPLKEIMIVLLYVLPTVPVYAGVLTGFSSKNQATTGITGLMAGGLSTVVFPVLTICKIQGESSEEMPLFIIVTLVFLVSGSFIAREMGKVGSRLKTLASQNSR